MFGRVARALSWLVLTLVIAGCTAGGGGNSSRWEQREIDLVLGSAFGEDLSQLEAFLDDKVALGFSDGEPMLVPRDTVIRILHKSIGGSPESPDSSPDSGQGTSGSLAFVERKYIHIGQGSASVQGLLYLRGTAHDAEIGLRRRAGGDWIINKLRLLVKQLSDPVGNPPNGLSYWKGEWESFLTEGLRGELRMTVEYAERYSYNGTLEMFGHPSGYTGGHFNAWYSISPPWTMAADGGPWFNIVWYDGNSYQNGPYYFTDISDVGYFWLYRQ